MTEDIILDVTADFIRGSQSNLKLALAVERAMPRVREQIVWATLKAVEERFPRTEWAIDRSAMQDVMARGGSSLLLRRESWQTNLGDAAIWLATNHPGWTKTWIGLYFSRPPPQEMLPIEQTVAPLTSRGFCFEVWDDEPGVWRFLDGELKDWSDERFLTRIVDEGPDRVASEISAELKQIDDFVGSLG